MQQGPLVLMIINEVPVQSVVFQSSESLTPSMPSAIMNCIH